jgi:hypothetical protein
MKWFSKKKVLDAELAKVEPPIVPMKMYVAKVVTDTETYSVDGIKEIHVQNWCIHWNDHGILLNQGYVPALFIPARRIQEIKFEEQNDQAD